MSRVNILNITNIEDLKDTAKEWGFFQSFNSLNMSDCLCYLLMLPNMGRTFSADSESAFSSHHYSFQI